MTEGGEVVRESGRDQVPVHDVVLQADDRALDGRVDVGAGRGAHVERSGRRPRPAAELVPAETPAAAAAEDPVREPRVDATRSSPLKKAPLRVEPSPAISIRNGTSAPFTTTDASQMPAPPRCGLDEHCQQAASGAGHPVK